MARWLRRHRTLTYGVATAAGRHRRRRDHLPVRAQRRARRREADARAEAESNFKMALKAVDNYLTNVSENRLLKEQETLDIRAPPPRSAQVGGALLQKIRANQRGDDPKLREQLANAYFRLGDITGVIGCSQEALKHYRSAHDLWEKLAKTDPANLEFQSRLADCESAIGKQLESGESC